MKPVEAAKALVGGCVVYVIMAACSGTPQPASLATDAGDENVAIPGADASVADVAGMDMVGVDRTATGDSTVLDVIVNDVSSVIDAITDPVKEAKADVNQSGTRLKARFYAGADGSKQFVGWHDTLRNEDCAYGVAADGETRCIPSGKPVSNIFADAACTQGLADVFKGCATPPTVVSTVQNLPNTTCGSLPSRTHLFPVGTIFSGTLYAMNGACVVADPNIFGTASRDFYSVLPEVPATAFVQATIQVEP